MQLTVKSTLGNVLIFKTRQSKLNLTYFLNWVELFFYIYFSSDDVLL